MRKQQRQEMLEYIKNLENAHEKIYKMVEERNIMQAQELLSECQEFAIQIGCIIEKLEGEGHVTVSCLEEYCEILYIVLTGLKSGHISNSKIRKLLGKKLLKIENSIKNNIPARIEVAFFPYKASMWDSMESVYFAAEDDPECDAYCVPIPYYDLNPDRSFGKMHYEGSEYKNIDITNWQEYNFEERRPDVIYIHNAYDNWNLVTSVHPRFYSQNLKKHTGRLVYIPYFVLDEIKPNEKEKIECMKHFCFMPGIINADKVVVQSENMRQIYIEEYMKAAKLQGLPEKHFDKAYLEQKFLGLGSPKFDKILEAKYFNL